MDRLREVRGKEFDESIKFVTCYTRKNYVNDGKQNMD